MVLAYLQLLLLLLLLHHHSSSDGQPPSSLPRPCKLPMSRSLEIIRQNPHLLQDSDAAANWRPNDLSIYIYIYIYIYISHSISISKLLTPPPKRKYYCTCLRKFRDPCSAIFFFSSSLSSFLSVVCVLAINK